MQMSQNIYNELTSPGIRFGLTNANPYLYFVVDAMSWLPDVFPFEDLHVAVAPRA